MASLLLGAVGGYFFGPIGFMVGSALGSLLDPQKSEGPRMQDKHLQGSTYGEPIPIVYGTMRLAGQVIWTTDLKEHKHKSGGKGGPQITTYTYSASFDVLICESPVLGVIKIWADSTLIYDTTGSSAVDNSAVPVTVYLGDPTQLPDPTEEAELGVGNVPAYRGICRCVFNDWDLGTWGNRIPQLTFEVFTRGGDIPWRVSSFAPWTTVGRVGFGATMSNGIITVSSFEGLGGAGVKYWTQQFHVDGTSVAPETSQTIPGFQVASEVRNLGAAAMIEIGSPSYRYWFYPDPANPTVLLQGNVLSPAPPAPQNVVVDPYQLLGNFNVYMNERVYCCGNLTGLVSLITYYEAPAGIPSSNFMALVSPGPFALDQNYAPSNVGLGTSDTGHLYVMAGVNPNCKLWKLDRDLNLVEFWDTPVTSLTRLSRPSSGINFHVYKDYIAFNFLTGTTAIALVHIDGGGALSDAGVLLSHSTFSTTSLGGGLGIDVNGVYSLDPPALPAILGEIVEDISLRCGLDATEIPDLPDSLPDLVPGYLIPRMSTGRDNIMELRTAYFFDAVESSAAMKFVKRGGPSVITIPDNDLAAQSGNRGVPPPLITVKRTQEVDLPATIWLTCFNPDQNYQNNTQYARRLVTHSQANARVDLSIAIENQDAATMANKLLYSAWLERNNFVLLTSRQYVWYEPTDVITAHSYQLRLTGKSNVASDVVQFEGVATNTGTFIAGPVGAAGAPGNPPVVGGKLATALLLLDIPLVIDADLENGLYAGMAGAAGSTGSTWSGATLNKSADGGASYADVGTLMVPTVMGTATTVLAPFDGGNIFDELNTVTVVIGAGGGQLDNGTELAVLNGANVAILGLELIQFKTATLTAPSTYDLTGLLRGRRGTEWAMQGHAVGDRFAVYPYLDAPLQFSELSLPRIYKPVTLNTSLATTTATTFTSMGAALQPYAPVSLGGGSDDIGDTTLQWIRRTRSGGAWQDFVDVPLGETAEQFIVQIWDATYVLCARIITVNNAESTIYTAADQVADFGAAQQTIYFTVGQVGAFTLGSQTRGAAAGSGGSNNAPLVPISPYSAGPGPAPGPTNPVSVVLLWDGSNSPHHTSGVVVGDVYVVEFTTDADPIGPGDITIDEYQDPKTYRTAILSTDTGGINQLAIAYGPNVGFIFGPSAGEVNLSTFTTYYVVITEMLPNGQPANPLGTNCDMVISF